MSDAQTRSTRATLYILFSACCFGSIAILISLAITSGAALIDLLAWRYVIAAVLLFFVSGGYGALRAAGSDGLKLLLFAGGGQALIAFVSLSALRYIPAATLTFLFYTYPAWVAVIAAIRRTDPLNGRRVFALMLSLGGLLVMLGAPGSRLHLIGVALALGSALLYALYIPMINNLGRSIPPAATATFAAGGAGLIFVVAAASTGVLTLDHAPIAWLSIILLAIVSTVIAFIVFLRGLAMIGPVRTAIISTVEPFWTALLGTLVLQQELQPRALVGGVLIAAAVVVLQLKGSQPELARD